ncbi:MAG: Gfo/Idh/MocA family oxidoreductase [Pseudomonadota bacterium]
MGAVRFAVASRAQKTAEAFATQHGFGRAHGSYAALMADREVDIVYVATPNGLHKEYILAALAAGKYVLCEKPLTLSVADSAACFDAARAAGRFLMETHWTAVFPAMQKAAEIVHSGKIGTPRHLTAHFVARRSSETHPILFDPTLGGGARNDLGIYPVGAALLLAGPVLRHSAQSVIGPTGVDEMTAITMEHENGALSLLSCGFRAEMPVAHCIGERGLVEIPESFYHPDRVILETVGAREVFDLPYLGNGYAHEAIAFQAALQAETPAPLWPECAVLAAAEILTAEIVTAGGGLSEWRL